MNLNSGIPDVVYAEGHTSPVEFRGSDQPDAIHRQRRRCVAGLRFVANDERPQRRRKKIERRNIAQLERRKLEVRA